MHTGSLQGIRQESQQLLSAGAVLQALLQIRVNGIAVVPPQHASPKDRIALAVYTQASMLNHACLPNTALSFNGRQLVLHASTHISEGEAVLTCYGPQVLLCYKHHAIIAVVCLAGNTGHMTTLCTCTGWRNGHLSEAAAAGEAVPLYLQLRVVQLPQRCRAADGGSEVPWVRGPCVDKANGKSRTVVPP